ncbi:MAG: DUF5652 family protein [Candidatus Liptonbacteria bacterium]
MYREALLSQIVGSPMGGGFHQSWGGFWNWGWLGLFLLLLVVVWSLIWKGFALWRAARNNSSGWFIALLIVNTLGILEILYIFVFGRRCCCGEKECAECAKKEGRDCCGECCCIRKMCRNGKR